MSFQSFWKESKNRIYVLVGVIICLVVIITAIAVVKSNKSPKSISSKNGNQNAVGITQDLWKKIAEKNNKEGEADFGAENIIGSKTLAVDVPYGSADIATSSSFSSFSYGQQNQVNTCEGSNFSVNKNWLVDSLNLQPVGENKNRTIYSIVRILENGSLQKAFSIEDITSIDSYSTACLEDKYFILTHNKKDGVSVSVFDLEKNSATPTWKWDRSFEDENNFKNSVYKILVDNSKITLILNHSSIPSVCPYILGGDAIVPCGRVYYSPGTLTENRQVLFSFVAFDLSSGAVLNTQGILLNSLDVNFFLDENIITVVENLNHQDELNKQLRLHLAEKLPQEQKKLTIEREKNEAFSLGSKHAEFVQMLSQLSKNDLKNLMYAEEDFWINKIQYSPSETKITQIDINNLNNNASTKESLILKGAKQESVFSSDGKYISIITQRQKYTKGSYYIPRLSPQVFNELDVESDSVDSNNYSIENQTQIHFVNSKNYNDKPVTKIIDGNFDSVTNLIPSLNGVYVLASKQEVAVAIPKNNQKIIFVPMNENAKISEVVLEENSYANLTKINDNKLAAFLFTADNADYLKSKSSIAVIEKDESGNLKISNFKVITTNAGGGTFSYGIKHLYAEGDSIFFSNSYINEANLAISEFFKLSANELVQINTVLFENNKNAELHYQDKLYFSFNQRENKDDQYAKSSIIKQYSIKDGLEKASLNLA